MTNGSTGSSVEKAQDILAWVDAEPTLSRYYSAARRLKMLSSERIDTRIAILRDFSLENVLPYLEVEAARAGIMSEVFLSDFGVAIQCALDPGSSLYEFEPDHVIVALRLHQLEPRLTLRFERLTPEELSRSWTDVLERLTSTLRAIRSNSSATLLVHNLEMGDHFVADLADSQSASDRRGMLAAFNRELLEAVRSIPGAYIVDVERLIASIGVERSIDPRYWESARAPYRPPLLHALACEYVTALSALCGLTKKCLVLDCDGTLWGGVIGEDGVSGIALGPGYPGSAYLDFQHYLLNLQQTGVLLAICSKNNEADVIEVLRDHPHSVIRHDHIAAMRVNWSDKATNLVAIALELNIGLDSMVFVDDSVHECEFVRRALPEVTVIQLPSEPAMNRASIHKRRLFERLIATDEDRKRTATYRAQSLRKKEETLFETVEEYLQSLGMSASVHTATSETLPRIAQLHLRTNQFNLTTCRFSQADLSSMIERGDVVLGLEVRDVFGDFGLVGAAILSWSSGIAMIESFLLSCRVIGRGAEDVLLHHLAVEASRNGCSHLVGRYIPTEKNRQVEGYYIKSGFIRRPDEDGVFEYLLSKLGAPSIPAWITDMTPPLKGRPHDSWR